MHLTIKGLVLRVSTYHDTDAIVTLLTHSGGKITAKARGLRRKNSPLAAPCQLLAYSEFTLFENRGLYTINEAHSLELFYELRKDLQKLSLGTYFAQVAETLSQEDAPDPELLSLVLNCLYALAKLNTDERLVKAGFELRSACVSGYTPDLSGCCHCHKPSAELFDLSEGHLACVSCRNIGPSGIRVPVSPGVLEAMRYLCYCDSKKLFAFQIGEESLLAISQISESYLTTQLERSFPTLDFYKTLLI